MAITGLPNSELHLWYHHNELTGTIPKIICFSIPLLDFSYNNLTGGFPEFLFPYVDQPELPVVDLSHNNLSGPLNISFYLQTFYFDVSHNQFSGQLPSEFNTLSFMAMPSYMMNWGEVATLDLSYNKLNGTIPPNFGTYQIEVLDLEFNNFIGPVPPLPANLTVLYVPLQPFISFIQPHYLRLELNPIQSNLFHPNSSDMIELWLIS